MYVKSFVECEGVLWKLNRDRIVKKILTDILVHLFQYFKWAFQVNF